MGLLSTLIIAAPLAAFSPFSTPQPSQLRDTAALNDSVTFVASAPSASVVNPGPAQTQRKYPSQVTESSGNPESCDRGVNTFSGTSTSIHDSDESPANRNIRFVQRTTGRCVEANLFGIVTFTADERDVAEMVRGARLRFHEVTGGMDREVTITSNGDRQRRDYLVNGRSADLDAEGQSWLGSMILTLMRESAYNAPERVRRLDREGGANRVLAEIDAIRSSNARRAYYEAYLELGRDLDNETLTKILTRIKRDFARSSSDMRSALLKVPARSVRTPESRTALASAMASIESDGDKSSLLAQKVPLADTELLLEIMDVALTIESDGDKARLLIIAAASYLNPRVSELRDAYFNVAKTVGSDGDLARVLINAAPYGHADAGVTEALIRTSHGIESDGDLANVLTYVATQKLLTTSAVRAAFMDAARSIESDGDRARVLRAAAIN